MIALRVLRAFVFVCGIAMIAWFAGLGMFVKSIEAFAVRPADVAAADAIVVLTGGSERLSAGFELLLAQKGKKLLISGVHPGLTLDHLPVNPPLTQDLRSCCVVLGHEAESTFGNADETHRWMQEQGYHSLRLVTANYHMPRSLLVFHSAMPDIEIIPYPVAPDNVTLDGWWQRIGTSSLLVTEYNKYLFAHLRLLLGPV